MGVDGGRGRADRDAGCAAGQGEQDGLGQELDPDVTAGRAEGTAQPDLGPAFENGDHHDVGDADGADEQSDRAKAEEQGTERALSVGLGSECR
jgi:hypothetical protein